MLRTDRSGAGAGAGDGFGSMSVVTPTLSSSRCRRPALCAIAHQDRATQYSRDGGDSLRSLGVLDPPLQCAIAHKAGDDVCVLVRLQKNSPAEPFRLARQLDRLDLLQLDRALRHQVVEVAV